MKKIIVTFVGSALIALSAVQFAVAAEHHRTKARHQSASEFRNSNAYAAPVQQPESYRYSGGYSDMAGR